MSRCGCGPSSGSRSRGRGIRPSAQDRANKVIDYRNQDFREAGERWDVVFDTVGASSFAESKPALVERGVFVPAVISINSMRSRSSSIVVEPPRKPPGP